MGALSKLAGLSNRERALLGAAATLLPAADLAVRAFGYQTTQRVLARPLARIPLRKLSVEERATRAQTVARCVRIASRRSPYRTTCLREALVTWWLLRGGGIEAEIVIGVARAEDELKSHAWVEVDGAPVIDESHAGPEWASIHRAGGTERAPAGSPARR